MNQTPLTNLQREPRLTNLDINVYTEEANVQSEESYVHLVLMKNYQTPTETVPAVHHLPCKNWALYLLVWNALTATFSFESCFVFVICIKEPAGTKGCVPTRGVPGA